MASDDVLAECDIQKLNVDIAAGSAAVVFDLKSSLYYDDVNVGVLTAEGVESASWSGSRSQYAQRFQAFYVGASMLSSTGSGRWRMWVGAINGQELIIEAETIEMWLGNVKGGDAAPPLYDEDSEEEILRRLYDWDTLATPVAWTSTTLI
ncbi:hypothetical protein [Actinomycetospora termitidis]|uniref:Uncharacterized protein n=1 Tax=Actinomycetospora termitidis TaxID=3053470 RepID=A0ABT7MHT7_9PSEU|nr:hypothetical protein [Actinomycetospora sp. Odt1-22]MDL5160240.1 hypothetical protein [Actinomycetospora sp. Odt1-22]